MKNSPSLRSRIFGTIVGGIAGFFISPFYAYYMGTKKIFLDCMSPFSSKLGKAIMAPFAFILANIVAMSVVALMAMGVILIPALLIGGAILGAREGWKKGWFFGLTCFMRSKSASEYLQEKYDVVVKRIKQAEELTSSTEYLNYKDKSACEKNMDAFFKEIRQLKKSIRFLSDFLSIKENEKKILSFYPDTAASQFCKDAMGKLKFEYNKLSKALRALTDDKDHKKEEKLCLKLKKYIEHTHHLAQKLSQYGHIKEANHLHDFTYVIAFRFYRDRHQIDTAGQLFAEIPKTNCHYKEIVALFTEIKANDLYLNKPNEESEERKVARLQSTLSLLEKVPKTKEIHEHKNVLYKELHKLGVEIQPRSSASSYHTAIHEFSSKPMGKKDSGSVADSKKQIKTNVSLSNHASFFGKLKNVCEKMFTIEIKHDAEEKRSFAAGYQK